MRAVWTAQARRDLRELIAYIAEDSPQNAILVKTRIANTVSLIEAMPLAGIAGRVPGTREKVASRTPYILVYKVEAQQVRILSVLRGTRKWPADFPS